MIVTKLAPLVLLAAPALAQTVLHHQQHYWPIEQRALGLTGYVRQTLGRELYFALLPSDDAIGWGHHGDPGHPNTLRIDAIAFQYVDTDPRTSNAVTVSVWAEDPLNPGLPQTTPIATESGFASGTGTAPAPAAFYVEVPMSSPVYVPRGLDVFLGVELQAEPANDALHLATIFGENPACCGFFLWDIANPRVPDTGHGLFGDGGFAFRFDFASGRLFSREDALVIVPMSEQPSLGVGAVTNQPNFTSSNPASIPGFTTSPFSGYQPSLTSDKAGRARADDPVLIYENRNFNGTELVGLLFAPLGFATAPFDLALIDPRWVGFLCLDQTIPPPTVALGSTVNGRFTTIVPIPSSARAGLLGLTVGWQAIGITGTLVVTSGCAVTAF